MNSFYPEMYLSERQEKLSLSLTRVCCSTTYVYLYIEHCRITSISVKIRNRRFGKMTYICRQDAIFSTILHSDLNMLKKISPIHFEKGERGNNVLQDGLAGGE